jgi:uncharacterized protein YegL
MAEISEGRYGRTEEVASRTMVLFFVVDASGSMNGPKIGALNEAINNVIPEIKNISSSSADAKIKIAVLQFSIDAEWLYPAPIDAEDFAWRYIEPGGTTAFGAACRELNIKLSRKTGFMNAAAGSFAPAIFLLSDGAPTDAYQAELEKLKNNNWFRNAIRVAVAIGDDANEEILADFTGSPEAVVKVHTPDALKSLIKFVAVTSSQIGSQSQDAGASGGTKQDEMIEQIIDFEDIQIPKDDDTDGFDW